MRQDVLAQVANRLQADVLRHGSHLDEEHDLDGNVSWNPARLLNHSCAPNCEAQLDDGHIWIVALRDIKAGEELTFNYGYELNDEMAQPCTCGTEHCCGYILAQQYWGVVKHQYTKAFGKRVG